MAILNNDNEMLDIPKFITDFIKSDNFEDKLREYCKGIIHFGKSPYIPIFIEVDSGRLLIHPILDGGTIYLTSIYVKSAWNALKNDSYTMLAKNISQRLLSSDSLVRYQILFGTGLEPFTSLWHKQWKPYERNYLKLYPYNMSDRQLFDAFVPILGNRVFDNNQYSRDICLTAFNAILRGFVPKELLSQKSLQLYEKLHKIFMETD